MDPERRRLLGTIRHRYDIVAHTHKTLEKERELVTKRIVCEKRLRLVLTLLNSAFVGGGVIAAVLPQLRPAALPTIVAGISALVAINKLTSTPEDLVHSHKAAAKSLLKVRNELFHLIEECKSRDFSNKEIRDKLHAIRDRLDAMEPLFPYTSRKAYELAREALATGGEGASTESDIDKLLPKSMREEETKDTDSDSSDDSDDSDISKQIGFA